MDTTQKFPHIGQTGKRLEDLSDEDPKLLTPEAALELIDNIHGLVMNGKLDCREKCQHIRMAIYKATGE